MALPLSSATVALVGGHGFIGQALMQRLLAAGAQVRVLSRHTPSAQALPAEVTWHTVSSSNTDSLQRALNGATTVVNLVGVLQSQRAQHVERRSHGFVGCDTTRIVARQHLTNFEKLTQAFLRNHRTCMGRTKNAPSGV